MSFLVDDDQYIGFFVSVIESKENYLKKYQPILYYVVERSTRNVNSEEPDH